MIELKQLAKQYGNIQAVTGLDLKISAGEAFGAQRRRQNHYHQDVDHAHQANRRERVYQ